MSMFSKIVDHFTKPARRAALQDVIDDIELEILAAKVELQGHVKFNNWGRVSRIAMDLEELHASRRRLFAELEAI